MLINDILSTSRNLTVAACCFLPLTAVFSAIPAMATGLTPDQVTGLDLGAAGDYALVDTGSGSTLNLNSGPLTGNVFLGGGTQARFSGGNNGQITGTLYYDSTVTGSFSGLQNGTPTTSLVSSSTTQSIISAADSVSNYASSLAATQTVGTNGNLNLAGTTTITGDGGLNVIRLNNIAGNGTLVLSGTSSDYYVFNVSGDMGTLNGQMQLKGVDPSHILWNLTGTGNVLQTSGGTVNGKTPLYGTFLSTTAGANFQFSNLDLVSGALIATGAGNDIHFVSGSLSGGSNPFNPGSPVPEPIDILGPVVGLACLAGMRKGIWLKRRNVEKNNAVRPNAIF